MIRFAAALVLVILSASSVWAQNQGQIVPSGTFTPGHAFRAQNSSGTVAVDAGGSAGSNRSGQGYLTELGLTNTGTPFCVNDALTNAVGGYHQFCVGANALGGGLISYNSYGGASPLPFHFNIDGTSYTFPFTVGGIVGPGTTIVGGITCWNNTIGTLVKDCGATTGSFFSNDSPPANIIFGERPFFGGARLYNGANPDPGATFVSTTALCNGCYAYLEREGWLLSYGSPNGKEGAFFASQTSTDADSCCSMGIAAFVKNDNTSVPQSAWPVYVTAYRASGTGNTGSEFDMWNAGADVPVNAYTDISGNIGATANLFLNAGGEPTGILTPHNVSMALYISGNGESYDRGIVIHTLSITGTYPIAMELPQNNRIVQVHNSVGNVDSFIHFGVGTDADAMGLVFADTGASFQDPTLTNTFFKVGFVASAVNFPIVTGGAASSGVQYGASGSDTNVPVTVLGKGTSGGLVLSSSGISFRYGSGGSTVGAALDSSGNLIFGPNSGSNIATNSTSPFLYVNTMAGAPSGTPAASATGVAPVVVDVTNHKFCWYEAAVGWKCATGS